MKRFYTLQKLRRPGKRLRVHRVRALHEVRMLQFIRSESMNFQTKSRLSSQSEGGSAVTPSEKRTWRALTRDDAGCGVSYPQGVICSFPKSGPVG
jgi:hypothetical protein